MPLYPTRIIQPHYEVGAGPVINQDTNIYIYFDSSGSMDTTLAPLVAMRDSYLKWRLLPFYNNDSVLYASKVQVIQQANERTIQMLNINGATPANNFVSLVFQDESDTVYTSGAPPFNPNATPVASYTTDIGAYITRLNAAAPDFVKGVVFQVATPSTDAPAAVSVVFKQFLEAVFAGTGNYAGSSGLSGRSEVTVFYDIIPAAHPLYYTDKVIEGLVSLGFYIPPPVPYTGFLLHLNGTNESFGPILDDASFTTWISQGNCELRTNIYKFGTSSIYLNGNDQFLQSTSTGYFNSDVDFTIEAWVYPTSSGTRKSIASKYTSVDNGWELGVSAAGYPQLTIGQGSYVTAIATDTIPLNQWSHVAATKSNTALTVYVNGALSGTAAVTAIPAAVTAPAYVGRDPLDRTRDWVGYIDEVRFSQGVRYTTSFTPQIAPFVVD